MTRRAEKKFKLTASEYVVTAWAKAKTRKEAE